MRGGPKKGGFEHLDLERAMRQLLLQICFLLVVHVELLIHLLRRRQHAPLSCASRIGRARFGARQRVPSSVCVCVCVCVGGWVQRSERDDGTFLDEKLVLDIFFNGVAIKVRAFARRRKERPFVRHVMEPCVPTCVCVCVCVCLGMCA